MIGNILTARIVIYSHRCKNTHLCKKMITGL
jgi:hypothetical protein